MIKVKITLRNGNHYELTSESTRKDMYDYIEKHSKWLLTIEGVDKTISVVSEEILAVEIEDVCVNGLNIVTDEFEFKGNISVNGQILVKSEKSKDHIHSSERYYNAVPVINGGLNDREE